MLQFSMAGLKATAEIKCIVSVQVGEKYQSYCSVYRCVLLSL